jgi:DNA-binding transcriptional regulator GbsR (MarR family)
MAEIYALLYMSSNSLTLEEMSSKLKTSRSNISLNVRGLLDLGVVQKEIIRGERKDYYSAEDDIAKVAKLLALAKKRKELDPAMEVVARAVTAASETTPESEDAEFITQRLEELNRHMEFVNAIFHAFVGSEIDAAGLAEVVKIKENHS